MAEEAIANSRGRGPEVLRHPGENVTCRHPWTAGLAVLAALLLGTAHLATSGIQWHPGFATFLVEEGNGKAEFATFLLLAASFLLAGGTNPAKAFRDIQDRLSPILGKSGGIALTVLLLLPQRLMDNNSGFRFVPEGTALSAIMLMLDVSRGFLAFAFFRWLLAAFPNRPEPWARGEAVGTFPGRLARTLPVVFLAVAIGIQFFVLENIPHVDDEIIQDWHLRLLSDGRVSAPPNPCLRSFAPDEKMADDGKRLFSTYQPGLVMVWLLVGRFLGTGLVNPLLGLLSLFILHRTIGQTHSRGVSDDFVFLLGTSPFFCFMASGRMNHMLSLTVVAVFLHGLCLLHRGMHRSGILLAGLSAGISLMTRRVDGAVLVLAGVVQILRTGGTWTRRILLLAVLSLLVGALFLLQSRLSQVHSGDAMQMVRQAQRVVRNFSLDGLRESFFNSLDNILGFGVFAFGGIIGGFSGIWLLGARDNDPQRAALEGFLAIHAALTIGVYGIYYYQDFCYGPRYFFGLLPAASLGVALLLDRLRNGGLGDLARRWAVIGMVFSLVVITNQVWSLLGNSYWHIDGAFQRFLASEKPSPAIVFLANPTRVRKTIGVRLARLGVPGPELMTILGNDSLDFHSLGAFVASLTPGDSVGLTSAITRAIESSRRNRPESFSINSWEVVRLNSADPLSQETIVALDLGDEPNSRLIRQLPNHIPLLAESSPEGFRFLPYSPSGIPNF